MNAEQVRDLLAALLSERRYEQRNLPPVPGGERITLIEIPVDGASLTVTFGDGSAVTATVTEGAAT